MRDALYGGRKVQLSPNRNLNGQSFNDIYNFQFNSTVILPFRTSHNMADDTRQEQPPPEDLSREALTVDPDRKAFSGDQWKDAKKDFKSAPAANILAGGTQNTAGGQLPEVSITNAFDGGLKMTDFTGLPSRPCVRESALTGLGSGFALGGVRFILRGMALSRYLLSAFNQERMMLTTIVASVFTACTWFVTGTCVVSGIMFQYCQYQRNAERDGMMRAVEILNKKEMEKKARDAYKEKQREARRELKEKELEEKYTKLREAKPWWKVW